MFFLKKDLQFCSDQRIVYHVNLKRDREFESCKTTLVLFSMNMMISGNLLSCKK